ncbi:unnamed protein product [Porites evermanni]|uniref:Uncharacterized protein n=1 Tax=Porites evermanni TaxID=104178 RepID=A0ABN8PFM8_9CNID|nr:unnamed protein product [Porites evermanni]
MISQMLYNDISVLSGSLPVSPGCKCGLAGLAEGVFESIAAYREVLECFLRQGKYCTAVEYTEKNSNLTRKDFLEAFHNVPLTDSIVSKLCNEYTENHLLSVQEAEDTLSRVLVGHACRRVARKMYGEKDFHSRQS